MLWYKTLFMDFFKTNWYISHVEYENVYIIVKCGFGSDIYLVKIVYTVRLMFVHNFNTSGLVGF